MSSNHTSITRDLIDKVKAFVSAGDSVILDGSSLDIAGVVAVSRRGAIPKLSDDQEVFSKVNRATAAVEERISAGASLYGVTTGVGATSFARTNQLEELQKALVAYNLTGIVPNTLAAPTSADMQMVLDEDFMRGTVMVRLNSLIRGHSGVRWNVITSMYELLVHDVVPLAAKNNTVSASGDLGTLAYIAGTLTGLPDLLVWYGKGKERSVRPAAQVLKEIQLKPLTYAPKEGLSILNGTAASASAAAQVLYDANVLLLAAQGLTVMAIEALRANLEPFEPFPHVVARPHPGQVEIAANIARMADGSKFAFKEYPEGDPEYQLRQDRYHIRCVPQWLGPFAESLQHAIKSVNIELNSTTDNPIVDPDGKPPHNIYHAGNFQALTPAEAMDTIRHVILGLGKILYAQHTEILNPTLNRGLPADCAAGEPNLDYGLKSSDLCCSAYLSEIGFLSGSFLPHINSTERHTQSINPMALASARYAKNCVQLLQQMVATYLYTVCQAIDLRAMNVQYLDKLNALLEAELSNVLVCSDKTTFQDTCAALFTTLRVQFGITASMESMSRFKTMLSPLITELYTRTAQNNGIQLLPSTSPVEWLQKFEVQARDLFSQNRMEYFIQDAGAINFLSDSGKTIYSFVRNDLKIPMKKGLPGLDKHEIGTQISIIFQALQEGRMDSVFSQAMRPTSV
ncbi:L-Aspartase-like protein [Rhodocollybia butyracea]|uniref:L-Aspartase-like protein n=1 Tax=Rhodocollybia butyracea TaxID=206335 RepID=A0A9P5PAU1_9AGAR|nr:L-Aspartase-like protein [Rhodocollybia butyracea]